MSSTSKDVVVNAEFFGKLTRRALDRPEKCKAKRLTWNDRRHQPGPPARSTHTHASAPGVEAAWFERINIITSGTALLVARVEMGVSLREGDASSVNEWVGLPVESKLIRWHRLDNLAATPASGSHPQSGMVIVPCSMGTLGAVASGAGTNLIHRART